MEQITNTSLVRPASISYSSAPDRGPWTYLAYSSSIRILSGNVFISDNMDTLPISNLGGTLAVDKFIILEVTIQNGIPSAAILKSQPSIPKYRTFGDEKSIQGQKTLSAVILALGGGVGSYFNESSGFGIHKCAWSDLMIYANCDGLIFLPAPFSLPSWASDSSEKDGEGGEGE